MNPCLPDWNVDCDVFLTSHKKPMGSDNELVELLWRNGHLVMHSQTHRRPSPGNNESRQVDQKHDHQILRGSGSYGNSSNIIHDDETVSWTHYPVEDTFEKEFCSNFFSELPNSDAMDTDKPIRQFEDDKFTELSASDATDLTPSAPQSNTRQPFVPEVSGNPMPPPRIQVSDLGQQNQTPGGVGKVVNFSQFAAPIRGGPRQNSSHFAGQASTNFTQGDIREGSVMTVGSSHCGSNQVANDPDFSRASSIGGGTTGFSAGVLMEDIQKIVSPNEGRKTETLEPTVTSSSDGSGSSFGGTTNKQLDTSSRKRKNRDDADELECQSGGAELDSASGKKPARSGSTRRTRAAEVHNLSERKRRDRINKKMRALQELIPHCNKTDKASMLDEAIDYLKSLQLQLQVMWMGSGMAPMMFPGVQHFMTPMGMAMGPSNLPAVHNGMHFPRVPMVDQSMPLTAAPSQTIHNPVMNQVNFQNQIQNQMFSDQFARYMGMHPIQAVSQPMNMFRFASPVVQPIHTSVPPASSVGPFTGGTASDDISSGKMGQ